MTNTNRVPKGVPTGGQFAEGRTAESTMTTLETGSGSGGDSPTGLDAEASISAALRLRQNIRDAGIASRVLADTVYRARPGAKTLTLSFDGDEDTDVWSVDSVDGEDLTDHEYDDSDDGVYGIWDAANRLAEVRRFTSVWQEGRSGDVVIDLEAARTHAIAPAFQPATGFDPVSKVALGQKASAQAWTPLWSEDQQSYDTERIDVHDYTDLAHPTDRIQVKDPEAQAMIRHLSDRAVAAGEVMPPGATAWPTAQR